jgi:pSer/pThr/pTyr-binding forkhead associated (FHA) protein
MTLDEAMLLYAFLPGTKVLAYIFRDVVAAKLEDSSQLDIDSLYKLLTVGYLKDRRSGSEELSPMPAKEGIEVPAREQQKIPSVILFVESGPLQGKRFALTLPCTIGRKECDVMLEDRLVSRRHAEIKIIDHKLVLEDLASKNGTRVNDEKVTKKQLNQNDLISIGPFRLKISNS